MASTDGDSEEALGSSPARISDPGLRREAQRAFIWVCVIGAVALTVYLAQSLLVLVAGMVLATMLDGGARLLGRWLPIGRGWRVAIGSMTSSLSPT